VVIPVIVIGILAFLIAWYAKKRRAASHHTHTEPIEMWAERPHPHEISSEQEPKEMLAFDRSQELDSGRPIKEMYAPPYQQKPPVELE